MAQREQRVTPLELFFDLVFVYAITQVTLLMSEDPTWPGVGRGLLVLAALWVVALAVDYLGVLIGRGQGWRVSPAHFAERHGLIVIIALGESIVAIGVGAAGVSLTPGIVSAAILGIVVIAALWWAYFDVYAVQAQRQLSETSGANRARIARDYYSYLHLPMIAGIVLFALGLKKTLEQIGDPLASVPAVALCAGLSLCFLSHVALRVRSSISSAA
jgi:low temperature requirement protein LtrA